MGTGDGQTIIVTPDVLARLLGFLPPPPVVPNPVPPAPTTPPDQGQSGLAAAGNAGVPHDQAASVEGDLDRKAHAADAAQKFPANESDASKQFEQIPQMIQQMVSGIAGAITGAAGGLMQPLTQMPQQAMQAAESAIQPLMGAAKGGGGAAEAALTGDGAVLDSATQGGAGLGGGGGGLGGGGTTPAGSMGPPPVPSSSPPTTPAAASVKSVPVTPTGGTPTPGGPMGMTGMPMMPGAMGAHGDGGGKDKPPEKRVTVPGIPNGQPVKGRLTVPPSVPVTKSGDAKPVVAKPNRRIVILPTDEEPQE
jgi:hypothetical protein